MKRGIKSLICIALVLVMSFSAAVPAFAVDLDAVYSVESNEWEGWPQGPEIGGDTACVLDVARGNVLYSKGMIDIGDAVKLSSRWTYNISPAKLAERQGMTLEELEAALD